MSIMCFSILFCDVFLLNDNDAISFSAFSPARLILWIICLSDMMSFVLSLSIMV